MMIKTQRQMLMKPAFLHDIQKLPARDVTQVLEKVSLLASNPFPSGNLKRQLVHCPGKPYRIRSGDYRIFYTFNQHFVNIYKIDRRHEGTYRDCPEAEYAPDDLDPLADLEELPEEAASTSSSHYAAWNIAPREESRSLPEPITPDLLRKLHVPSVYHERLLRISNQDDLLACPGIKDDVLLEIDAYMFERPLVQVMQQPDLVLNDIEDLVRYRAGDLITFLLKLSPEQQRYTHWSLNVSGPTLVKGGPGTGKSTVALYRIRSMLEQSTEDQPRILFTTYTNALIKASEQQLAQLLGEDVQYVQVNTADKLVYQLLHEAGIVKDIIEDSLLRSLTRQAISQASFPGNLLRRQAQQQTIQRMGLDYLLQEINTVIVARQLASLEAYQATPRAGRRVRLNATQRQAVWLVYEQWRSLLQKSGKETWQQRRARAAALVEQSQLYHTYDAVVIDEAQDLDPGALRMLIALCKASNRLFITADANQSIYGSGFTWQDVHRDLKFQGRTGILRANYRSTAEIGEAANSYLNSGALEAESGEGQYINNGPLPDVRAVSSNRQEIELLAGYFKKAVRNLRLTSGSCVVLCPGQRIGQNIAHDLRAQGLETTYMEGRELDLKRSGVKVMTLHSAKGLEFPIVALAGFLASNYPSIPRDAAEDERAELLARERRTMFVGMTRAMRALLVVTPTHPTTPLLTGFDPNFWNTRENM